MFEIDMLRVFLSGVAAVVLGMVWYHPRVFGTIWMRLINLSPSQMEEGKKHMLRSVALGCISNIIFAYVFAHFAIMWGVFDVLSALQLAFWTWFGIQMPVSLSAVLWEQRAFTWFLITSGYLLLNAIIMSLIFIL